MRGSDITLSLKQKFGVSASAINAVWMSAAWISMAGSLWIAPELPAQSEPAEDEIAIPAFHEYDPPSTLVVPRTEIRGAKFPFVDVHNHQWQMPTQDLAALTAEMDALNMAVMVNLSGRGSQRVQREDGSYTFTLGPEGFLGQVLDNVKKHAPQRFLVFTNVDPEGIDEDGWTERAVAQLTADVKAGAAGLKVYKGLGLDSRDSAGRRIAVDDARLDPIWARCGELGIPVLIHTGEPAAFWLPKDGSNERLLEMMERPGRWRGAPGEYPSWDELMAEQHRVFRRHPETTFINAHLGWMGNDLDRLGRLLDDLPNVHTEIGAVIAELGRQPRFARKWLTKYQDRVLFGKDTWRPSEYETYFRVLETDDDYIKYFRKRHAFWRLYGLDLPDEVLRKIYYGNALRLFPTLDPALFPRR